MLDAAESAEDWSVPERAWQLSKGAFFGLGIHDAPLVHLISFAGLPTAASDKVPCCKTSSLLVNRFNLARQVRRLCRFCFTCGSVDKNTDTT